ncbi:hypothetical protein Pstr01_13010 [Pseudomonas straminea]|nr:arginine N-succinyltransferase [Pseudomonas straminea]GLX13062.1 hypothetical protein Pstr01_13010 [Pseudomonas straminea]
MWADGGVGPDGERCDSGRVQLHFFDGIDANGRFDTGQFADQHPFGVGNKAFIAELMPRFPLYTCFLSEAAREVIGRVHPDTEPALAMLKSEGFSYQGYVDIFDAGPAIEAETTKIRAIRDSQLLVLAIGTPGDDAPVYLVHNRKHADCRITAARARMAAGTLVVDPLTARRLRLNVGDQVRAVPLAVKA